MNYSPEFFVAHSKDKEAVMDLRYWQDRRRELAVWKRKEKAEADRNASAARQRCIDAGIDWDSVPRPPKALRAPDRAHRPAIGQAFTPAAGAASLAPGAQAHGSGAPTPGSVPQAVGGGAAAGAAAGLVGGLAGAGIWHWLQSGGAEAFHHSPDGAWFEAQDGSFWFQDARGEVFGLADNGSWLATDPQGFLWAFGSDGGMVSWAADGTMVSLQDNGALAALDAQGNMFSLGEDGSWYMQGADGTYYTQAADGSFWGVDGQGNYVEAPEGSGLAGDELAAADYGDGGEGGGDEGGLFDWL
jgi:hypothetical protein